MLLEAENKSSTEIWVERHATSAIQRAAEPTETVIDYQETKDVQEGEFVEDLLPNQVKQTANESTENLSFEEGDPRSADRQEADGKSMESEEIGEITVDDGSGDE